MCIKLIVPTNHYEHLGIDRKYFLNILVTKKGPLCSENFFK